MSAFDKDAGLTADDARAMQDIVDEARPLVQECLPQTGDSPQRQLAAVVSAVHAEEHVNNGIVRMGELLDPDIADRFRQRIPFFRSRVALVSSWVEKATKRHELTPDEAAERDRLLSDVTVASRSVDADLEDDHPLPRRLSRQASATRRVWRVAGRGSYRCQVTPVAVTVAV